MEVRRTVTYQQIKYDEEVCITRRKICDLYGNKIGRVKAWRAPGGLVVVDLGNGDWLMPVIDHTGRLGSKKDQEVIQKFDDAINGTPEKSKWVTVDAEPDLTDWEKLVEEAGG